MAKVSFVMPVKNGEKTIRKTIESLINQTEKDIEIIIVNDHSEDKTVSIIEQIQKKDPRIVLLHSDKNGVGAARNFGTNRAEGDIILPTDGDDPNYPERAEVSLKELEQNKADIFYSNLMRYFPEENNKELRHFQPYEAKLLTMINFIAHSGSSAYYKYVFDKVGGYDEKIAIGEDWDFWLKAQETGYKFCYKNIPLSLYTMHAGQVTTTVDIEAIKKRQEWNKRVREKHKIFDIDPEYVKEHGTQEIVEFYVNKNYDIWFGGESIPRED